MKLKDYQLNSLYLLLLSINKENLVNKEATFEQKCQAMSKRRAILKLFEESNKEFKENIIEKIESISQKIGKEWKETLAELDSIEAKTDDEKKIKAKEKVKKEEEINENLNKKVEALGIKTIIYRTLPTVQFVEYLDSKNAKEVNVVLSKEHEHVKFLQYQLKENIYKMNLPDDLFLDLMEIVK